MIYVFREQTVFNYQYHGLNTLHGTGTRAGTGNGTGKIGNNGSWYLYLSQTSLSSMQCEYTPLNRQFNLVIQAKNGYNRLTPFSVSYSFLEKTCQPVPILKTPWTRSWYILYEIYIFPLHQVSGMCICEAR